MLALLVIGSRQHAQAEGLAGVNGSFAASFYFFLSAALFLISTALAFFLVRERRRCQRALTANAVSEQRFRNLFEQPLVGMAFEDLDGRLLQVNQEMCSILGYSEDELLAMTCDQFARAEDASDELALLQELQEGKRENYHIEKAYLRKDGTKVWGRLHVCRLHLPGDESPKILAVVEDITERKQAEQRLNYAQRTLHDLTGRLIQGQEEERRRIARELHDDIGQRLSLLMMELDRISREIPAAASHTQFGSFARALQQVDEITKDVHELSHQLHSTKLHYVGLRAALRELCQQFATQQRIAVAQNLEDIPDLPSEVELCLYRVAQEALRNAAKHSHASSVSVSFSTNAGMARLEVEDTGVGFDLATATAGLGLASMRERLRLLDGELVVTSAAGKGTRVVALVRYEQEESISEAA